jgi:hypothetical protein
MDKYVERSKDYFNYILSIQKDFFRENNDPAHFQRVFVYAYRNDACTRLSNSEITEQEYHVDFDLCSKCMNGILMKGLLFAMKEVSKVF